MDERHLVLDRRIRKDLEILETLWAQLDEIDPAVLESNVKEVIVTAYRLHNLYNAAENIFRNITSVFGNHLDPAGGWHAELLDRMRLDLTPLRPAVLDDTTFAHLDELRRFRHVFRAAYSVELDAERLTLVLRRALALRDRLPGQVEAFLIFLGTLE